MSARGFFRNYFYGRPNQKDFTEADLPANRLELFRTVLRTRFGSMIGLNFLYLLIWLPAIIWSLMNLLLIFQIDAADSAAFLQSLRGVLNSYLLLLFPLIAITGPFNMGASYVLRNWARDEHSFLLADFKSSMKENWKQGLLLSTISGVLPLLVFICIQFYTNMAQSSPLFYLPLLTVLLAAAVWYLSTPLLPTMIVTYRQGFAGQVRNALLITLASLPRAAAVRFITLFLPILLFALLWIAPGLLGLAAGITAVLYAVFMLAFNKLVCASYANALCEKYLNPKIDGAQVDIGLRPKHETEENK